MHTDENTSSAAGGVGFDAPSELLSIDRRLRWRGRVLVALLLLGVGAGAVAYVHQLRVGLAATGMSDAFSWGIYVVNFVFFIGVSMAGTLISALLRLTNAEWRRPITRLAEAITVCSLLVAAPMIVIDMGRPDRLLYVLLHGRVQSPIVWDVLSLTTYLAGSVLYLYVPMIPDLAILRDRAGSGAPMRAWRRRLYAALALGWRGSPEQARLLHRAIAILAVFIIPVAVSIHTVTAWLFGMTLRPGWHSTIIGPDFVVGALYSGMAAVITAIAIFRAAFGLGKIITREHFMRLGFLLVVFGILYGYFMVNEYLGGSYAGPVSEHEHIRELLLGRFARTFWIMAGVGLIIPIGVLLVPRCRTVKWIVAMAVLVNVGMWLKRYIIIVPTLATPFMPTEGGKELAYTPTWVEWAITLAAFCAFALLYLAFARLFPIVSLWELAEGGTEGAGDAKGNVEGTPPARAALGSVRASRAATTVALAALIGLQWPGIARAQDAGNASKPATAATVALSVATEDGKRMIVATVTAGGKPVEGAKVRFGVQRTFGTLFLGEEATLDDGTAAVPFPEGLPGDAKGELRATAAVTSPADLASSRGEAMLGSATPPVLGAGASEEPRALWAPRAPLGLLATVAAVVAVVWSSYLLVISYLWRIWKERTVA